MQNKPQLNVDFDGVLHSYISGWQGPDIASDPPVDGMQVFLTEAVKDFKVCIFSSRNNLLGGIKCMKDYLSIHGVPDYVMQQIDFPQEKGPAFLTLDDRAYCFKGKFPSTKTLLSFIPWCKKVHPKPERGTCEVCHKENVKLHPKGLIRKCTRCYRRGYGKN